MYALVRAGDQAQADERLRETVATVLGHGRAYEDRMHAVPGDVEQPELGLDEPTRESLAGRVTDIVHSAASVSFTDPLEDMRRINVEGTRRVLDLAERCNEHGGLRRFSHISTAYVAGTQEGDFRESVLDVGQDFHNDYERTKFEAEKLVRERRGRLPVRVMRPSIIVGERASGWTASFNVLYGPLKAFARGALPALPADPAAPVDVVPVDYVADAVFTLANEPPAGPEEPDTYHLVAGRQATTVDRLVKLSARLFGRRAPVILPPSVYSRVVHPLLMRSTGARASGRCAAARSTSPTSRRARGSTTRTPAPAGPGGRPGHARRAVLRAPARLRARCGLGPAERRPDGGEAAEAGAPRPDGAAPALSPAQAATASAIVTSAAATVTGQNCLPA